LSSIALRYLVTGGAGVLGASACRQLLAGDDEVTVYDLGVSPTLERTLGAESARAIVVRGDTTDAFHLLSVARDRRVESIIHLASLLGGPSSDFPARAVQVNCGGMVNVLETARFLGIKRVVWASSAGVFAGHTGAGLVAEDAPFTPTTIYAGTKVLNEVIARHYRRAYGIEATGLRFTLVTGAAQPASLAGQILAELVHKPVRSQPGRVPWGDDTPSWLWVDDAARALVLAARAPGRLARTYNIAGDRRPLRDAAEIVRALLPGVEITLEPGVGGLAHHLETTAAERDLGFRPEWTLEAQLRELIREARGTLTPGG
jgi:nucleoside-diphosphate-sugar epimerase